MWGFEYERMWYLWDRPRFRKLEGEFRLNWKLTGAIDWNQLIVWNLKPILYFQKKKRFIDSDHDLTEFIDQKWFVLIQENVLNFFFFSFSCFIFGIFFPFLLFFRSLIFICSGCRLMYEFVIENTTDFSRLFGKLILNRGDHVFQFYTFFVVRFLLNNFRFLLFSIWKPPNSIGFIFNRISIPHPKGGGNNIINGWKKTQNNVCELKNCVGFLEELN